MKPRAISASAARGLEIVHWTILYGSSCEEYDIIEAQEGKIE